MSLSQYTMFFIYYIPIK
uniref:Uncharacterized protein n=1 Tax=Anguilla anguilla TaxID=7936 RepID=A0A0E9VAP3_ANGAN